MKFRNVLSRSGRTAGGAELREASGAIENPTTGERIAFRDRRDDDFDAPIRFDYYLDPGGFAVGRFDHVHPLQEERISVESGRLGVRIDGDEWTATPGTRFAVLPGTPHTVWNDADRETHAVIEFTPSLNIADFFETTFGLAAEGRTNRWGIPGPRKTALLLDDYRDEFAFAGIPLAVQRALAEAIASLARSRGHRPRY